MPVLAFPRGFRSQAEFIYPFKIFGRKRFNTAANYERVRVAFAGYLAAIDRISEQERLLQFDGLMLYSSGVKNTGVPEHR